METGSVALRTPLCDLLGMRYPIIQAPMAGMTTVEMVAGVANAGGLGMLALGRMSNAQVVEALDATRERTEGVFGVNFLIAPNAQAPDEEIRAVQSFLDRFRPELDLPAGAGTLELGTADIAGQLDLVLEFGMPVVSFALGIPGDLIERVHSAGALAMVMVTTVEEAQTAVAAGADVIVAQGLEAGGHRSIAQLDEQSDLRGIGTLALVPQIVDAVSVPVVASGGIMDGRGIIAALALGAQGVQMGTRFIGARESTASEGYRRAMRDASAADTVISRAFTGRPARVIANRLSEEFRREGQTPLGWGLHSVASSDIVAAARARDDTSFTAVYAGQGVGMLGDVQPAATIVDQLVSEAEHVLTGLTNL